MIWKIVFLFYMVFVVPPMAIIITGLFYGGLVHAVKYQDKK